MNSTKKCCHTCNFDDYTKIPLGEVDPSVGKWITKEKLESAIECLKGNAIDSNPYYLHDDDDIGNTFYSLWKNPDLNSYQDSI